MPRSYTCGVPVLARLLRDVVDLCYPQLCALCKAACDEGSFLCPECDLALHQLQTHPACEGCGAPLATREAPCPFCQGKAVRHYRCLLRLGTFSDPLKDLIHRMKYNRQWVLAELLATRLLAQRGVQDLLDSADVLVPVPLHFLRQFRRGFNQAEIIARQLAKLSGKPVVRPISRVRHTESQTQLTRQKRMQNVRDAFRLNHPETIRGKHLVVIDDVMTTGATLQTVARTLRRARPASLSALLLAVADPKGRDFRAV